MESSALLERHGVPYDGPWELCKGEAKAQMKVNNDLATKQLAQQQDFLNRYKDYVSKVIAGGGYLPGVKEAAVSNATTSVPLNYEQIRRQLATRTLRTGGAGGGTLPGGGTATGEYGDLLSKEAMAKAGLLNDITIKGQDNINTAEGGVLNAAAGTGSTGSSIVGSATSAANTANQQSGLLGTIIGGGLGVLGSFLGKPPARSG